MTPTPESDDEDTRLDALFRSARSAPLPRVADRLALGFGSRMEAHARAATAETMTLSRWLWGWVSGLGACSAIVVAVAMLGATGVRATASTPDTSFQEDWITYTSVPDIWPE